MNQQSTVNPVRAIWNGAVIAESDDTVIVEGNHYFPKEAVSHEMLRSSDDSSVCHWKGTAAYYDVVVDGQTNDGAAFYYPEPKDEAAMVADRIAFWKGVEVG